MSDGADGGERPADDPRSAHFHAQRTSFDRAGEVYERSRPSYPAEAVDWLLGAASTGTRVLDVGAGTGKLTRLLVERGCEIVAVDPAEGMLGQLRGALPSVDARVGSAEQLPVDDGSVDLVLAAQAWHWVDQARALPEAARVLRPGGALGLIWNIRDERVPWVARLGAAMGSSEAEIAMREGIVIGAPFGATTRHDTEWARPMTLDELLDLVRSRSYLITASDEARSAVLDRVRGVVRDEFGDDEGLRVELPYRTHAFRAVLPA